MNLFMVTFDYEKALSIMLYIKTFIFSFLIFLTTSVWAQIDHWESVVPEGAEVKYILPDAEPASSWTTSNFDDSNWQTGITSIGYGDEDDATVINPTESVYLRKAFNIIDIAAIEKLYLHMDFDDGFVAYLNGVEIARVNMTGSPPAFDQFSNGLHEALLYRGMDPELFEVDISLLNEGGNILAVQVHNQSLNSSDLTALPVLSVGINNTSSNYFQTPDWFRLPVNFVSSNLPIVIISTTSEIPDEPKVSGDMKIVFRGGGQRTFLSDQNDTSFLDFDGKIRIETRGSSSESLPKKQYGFTTYDPTGIDKDNVELLGMPSENDWILNGLAFDPSLMRDYIAYNLSRRIGEYASRTQYCELVINGEYRGLYILQEKMKKDDDRIDIDPVSENTDGDLSGGYITKSDKIDANDPVAWSMPNYSGWNTNFVHVEPKPEEVTAAQQEYIKGQFEKLQAAAGQSNSTIINGYPSIIDMPSFINFMILNELASNVDGYQFSTYFHKDKKGKLRAGPIWDFNLTFGNDLFQWDFDRSHTDVWQFYDGGNVGAMFWKDLFDDNVFRCYLAKRWHEVTSEGQPMHLDSLLSFVDETAVLIQEAAGREQQKWGTIDNHEEDIANMKTWIAQRMEWMNNNIGSFSACANVTTPPLVISKINYNPYSIEFGDAKEQEFIEITNNGDEEVDLTGIYFGGTGFVYQFPAESKLATGASLRLANDRSTFYLIHNRHPFDEFTRSLSNNSERLLMLDAYGNVIDDVTYSDDGLWPASADGGGYYLELKDLNANNNEPSNWMASVDQLEWTILGVEDGLTKVSIYPNPTSGLFRIRSDEEIKGISITDVQGKVLPYMSINHTSFDLDLSEYEGGIYVLRIYLNNGVERHRVVKY